MKIRIVIAEDHQPGAVEARLDLDAQGIVSHHAATLVGVVALLLVEFHGRLDNGRLDNGRLAEIAGLASGVQDLLGPPPDLERIAGIGRRQHLHAMNDPRPRQVEVPVVRR